jgi:hypothetical protein
MSFLFAPWRWMVKPAALPILSGTLGMFYGSYDLTVMTFGRIIGSRHHSECSFSHQVAAFSGGLVASAAGIYGRTIIDPAPIIPPMDKSIQNANKLTKLALQSVHSMKTFPYRWYITSTAAAGFMTGIFVSVARC